MSAPRPLAFPLAGLLADPIGSDRLWPISGVTIPLAEGLRLAGPIEGTVHVTRTNRGVYVDAPFRTSIEGECARCLRETDVPISIRIQEEALPSIDLASGAALDRTVEPDVVRLDDHHELDLEPLVADAISLAEPIAPLCEPDCPGLCTTCGERLGPDHGPHEEADVDPRLAALRSFRVDGEAENE